MTATAFGMPLTILRDGVVATFEGASRSLPLIGTTIDIEVLSGLAVSKLTRRFRNAESKPIEVLMTFPVGFHSAVTGMRATVDGHTLVGRAQAKEQARETYEAALGRGELAVLHEEPLRGLNVISIAPLPPGVEVEVCAEIVTPLSLAPNGAFLRLPMTIGEVYGDSPLLPADDVLAERGLASPATLSLRCDVGTARLPDGQTVTADEIAIELNKSIEITIENHEFGVVHGTSADGQRIELTFAPVPTTNLPLSCAILFDRSGSTSEGFPETVWQSMRNGLEDVFGRLLDTDEIALWQFNSNASLVGKARGAIGARRLLEKLDAPAGETELVPAIMAAANAGANQILVLTDGRAWSPQAPADLDASVHAVLIGPDSLDASIGHLATQTGGEVFYVASLKTTAAISTGLSALRAGSSRVAGTVVNGAPHELICKRSGISIEARWLPSEAGLDHASDPIGRFAAMLALPLFDDIKVATSFAAAHDLVCHLTSLVLVDPLTGSGLGLPRTVRQPLALDPAFDSRQIRTFACSADIVRRTEMPAALHRKPGAPIGQRQAGPKKSLFDRIFGFAKPSPCLIDWDRQASNYLKGDLSSIPKDVLNILRSWAGQDAVKRIAKKQNQTAILVALALYAKREFSSQRNANRFAKKVLDGVDTITVQETLAHLIDL